jgi:hypothetical protein
MIKCGDIEISPLKNEGCTFEFMKFSDSKEHYMDEHNIDIAGLIFVEK